MIYTVKITDEAEKDIRLLCRYIADELENPSSAFRQACDLYDAIETLDEMPGRFPLRRTEPWKSRNIHSMPVNNYNIFYMIGDTPPTVTILRVLYNRRDV